MAYVKHPVHGNKHVEDSEVAALVEQGYVQWPRTPEEKALGDGSDAAYWRKKYARDMAAPLEHFTPAIDGEENHPVRRGRPPKA